MFRELLLCGCGIVQAACAPIPPIEEEIFRALVLGAATMWRRTVSRSIIGCPEDRFLAVAAVAGGALRSSRCSR